MQAIRFHHPVEVRPINSTSNEHIADLHQAEVIKRRANHCDCRRAGFDERNAAAIAPIKRCSSPSARTGSSPSREIVRAGRRRRCGFSPLVGTTAKRSTADLSRCLSANARACSEGTRIRSAVAVISCQRSRRSSRHASPFTADGGQARSIAAAVVSPLPESRPRPPSAASPMNMSCGTSSFRSSVDDC